MSTYGEGVPELPMRGSRISTPTAWPDRPRVDDALLPAGSVVSWSEIVRSIAKCHWIDWTLYGAVTPRRAMDSPRAYRALPNPRGRSIGATPSVDPRYYSQSIARRDQLAVYASVADRVADLLVIRDDELSPEDHRAAFPTAYSRPVFVARDSMAQEGHLVSSAAERRAARLRGETLEGSLVMAEPTLLLPRGASPRQRESWRLETLADRLLGGKGTIDYVAGAGEGHKGTVVPKRGLHLDVWMKLADSRTGTVQTAPDRAAFRGEGRATHGVTVDMADAEILPDGRMLRRAIRATCKPSHGSEVLQVTVSHHREIFAPERSTWIILRFGSSVPVVHPITDGSTPTIRKVTRRAWIGFACTTGTDQVDGKARRAVVKSARAETAATSSHGPVVMPWNMSSRSVTAAWQRVPMSVVRADFLMTLIRTATTSGVVISHDTSPDDVAVRKVDTKTFAATVNGQTYGPCSARELARRLTIANVRLAEVVAVDLQPVAANTDI